MAAPVTIPAMRVLRFEAFELDLHAGVRLRLQGQPIQRLGILAPTAGSLVTREELTGQLWPADAEFQKAIAMSDNEPEPTTALAHAYAVIGKRAEAKKMLADPERKSKRGYVSPYLIATMYAGLGDKDDAMEFLGKAYRERSMDLSGNLRTGLRIDNLRLDPRFAALERRVGFPD